MRVTFQNFDAAIESEETIIFKTHTKHHILWSLSQLYHFFQDIFFVPIPLSLPRGDSLSDGLKENQNNAAVQNH